MLRPLSFVIILCAILSQTFSIGPVFADGDETPVVGDPYEPRIQPRLALTVPNIEDSTAELGDTLDLTVIVTNQGSADAENVTLSVDGNLDFSANSIIIPTLPVSNTITTTVSLLVQAVSSDTQTVFVTVSADNAINPTSIPAEITFATSENHNPYLTPTTVDSTLLLARRISHPTYQGSFLVFDLAWPDKIPTVSVDVASLLATREIPLSRLDLMHQTKDGAWQPVVHTRKSATLTFTPTDNGIYAVQISPPHHRTSGDNPVPDPDPYVQTTAWFPTFNEPTISLMNGSVSYGYPIEVPPGPGGFTPQLSLGYSGTGGNGLLGRTQSNAAGFGWNIGGTIEVVQAIRTCATNVDEPHDPLGAGDIGCADKDDLGNKQFTLSLGGTGYELTHTDGATFNGDAGRYYAKGSPSLYVEYCQASSSLLCINADDSDDIPYNGSANWSGATEAENQVSQTFWVVKSPDNTTYRLGYNPDSEQELRKPETALAGQFPDSVGAAMKWRVDHAQDTLGNQITYQYLEVHHAVGSGRIQTPGNYLQTISYGRAEVRFTYINLGIYGKLPGTPGSTYDNGYVLSWQDKQLQSIAIYADDYASGNGSNLQLVRTYDFTHEAQRFGLNQHQENPDDAIQTAFCATADYNGYTNWKTNLLTAITISDKNGNARIQNPTKGGPVNVPDIEFTYEFRKTAYWDDAGSSAFAEWCAPYMLGIHTPYDQPNQSVASFAYDAEGVQNYHAALAAPDDTESWINTVDERTLRGGYGADTPDQVTSYDYIFTNHPGCPNGYSNGIFNGFCEASRNWHDAASAIILTETTHFHREDDTTDSTRHGRIEWSQVTTAAGDEISRVDNTWTVNGGGATEYTTLTTAVTNNTNDNIVNRVDYAYDTYANLSEQREFGADLTGSTPLRTVKTDYVHNESAASGGTTWLIGLPQFVSVWEGAVDWPNNATKLQSLTMYQYDNQDDNSLPNPDCDDSNRPDPNIGLLRYVHVKYELGTHTTNCQSGVTTTEYTYAQNTYTWQLDQIIHPSGAVDIYTWNNAITLASKQTIADSVAYTTSYAYDDDAVPWLLTGMTAPNGASTSYDFDTFGRLKYIYPPDPATGQPLTTASLQVVYEDHPAINPLAVRQIANPGDTNEQVTRTFYDALGRPIQQVAWATNDKAATLTVVDTAYDERGQAICQTAPLWTNKTKYLEFACTNNAHVATAFSPAGQPYQTTGLDSVQAYGAVVDRTTIGIDGNGYLSVATTDTLNRLASVEEMLVNFDSFETGSFDSTGWTVNHGSTTSEGYLQLDYTGSNNVTTAQRVATPLEGGESVFFRFKLDDVDADEGHFQFYNAAGNTRLRLDLYDNLIYPTVRINGVNYGTWWDGTSWQGVSARQVPAVWYRAEIVFPNDGTVTFRVWQEDAPENGFTYRLTDPTATAFFDDLDYTFIARNLGREGIVYLSDYQEGEVYETRYDYDWRNNLTQVTRMAQMPDPNDNIVTTMAYDRQNRKTTMDDPDMGHWEYVYDDSGNLIEQTDALDNTLCFEYDQLNRITVKEKGANIPSPCLLPSALVSYEYFESGLQLGQLERVNSNAPTSPGYTTDWFSYDYRGRVTATTRTIGTETYTVSTQYDNQDRPTQITYPTGEIVSATYDERGPDTLTSSIGNTQLVQSVHFNRRGQLTNIQRGNNIQTLYTYGNASDNFRLQSLEAQAVHFFAYQYDAVGNITSIDIELRNSSNISTTTEIQTFAYDSLNRLVSAEATGTISAGTDYEHAYTYDPLGNLTQINDIGNSLVTNYQYNGSSHPHAQPHAVTALTGGTTGSFAYDANGNMTSRTEGSTTYTQDFDVENRLTDVQVSGGDTTTFYYDANGQRVMSVVEDGTTSDETEFYYPFPIYEEEHTPAGDVIERSSYAFAGQTIAQRVEDHPTSSNNGLFYAFGDHLGSSTALTDDTTNAVVAGSRTFYLPFGGYRGTQPTTNPDISDHGYTDHKHNDSIGLVYMNTRYYVPSLARFASADTIVSQSHNRFSYVLNNPCNFTDPTGHCSEIPPWAEGDHRLQNEIAYLEHVILEASVGIRIHAKIEGDGIPASCPLSGLGTVTEEDEITTHDHWMSGIEECMDIHGVTNLDKLKISKVELFDSRGDLVETISGNDLNSVDWGHIWGDHLGGVARIAMPSKFLSAFTPINSLSRSEIDEQMEVGDTAWVAIVKPRGNNLESGLTVVWGEGKRFNSSTFGSG